LLEGAPYGRKAFGMKEIDLVVVATTAQGAATFIAVVAAFLLSQVFEAGAKRKVLEDEMVSIEQQLSEISSALDRDQQELKIAKISDFPEDFLLNLLSVDGDLSAALERWDSQGRSQEIDPEVATWLSEQILGVTSQIHETYQPHTPIPQDLSSNNFSYDGNLLKPEHVDQLIEASRRSRKENVASNFLPKSVVQGLANLASVGDAWKAQMEANPLVSGISMDWKPGMQFQIGHLEENIEHLLERKERLNDRLVVLRDDLKGVMSARGYGRSIWLVALFGGLGVIMPLTTLMFGDLPVAVPGIMSIAAFATLFGALLLYLGQQIRELRRPN